MIVTSDYRHKLFCLQSASKENAVELMFDLGIVYTGSHPYLYKLYVCSGPEGGML